MGKLAFVYFMMCVIATVCFASRPLSIACNAEYCNPNWTPFDNMVAGLRGYNIRKGDPFHDAGDPGFVGQIFIPTKENNGRMELETGITASELSACTKYFTSKSFTTMSNYRKYVERKSRSGVELQLGTEREVTAGINYKGVEVSSKTTIPPAFQRAWGDSSDFKELKDFFSKQQGMVSIARGTCTMYDLRLDRYNLPPFTKPFETALVRLYQAQNSPKSRQIGQFRKFIREYGTHFLARVKMGAEFMYRSKYSKSIRKVVDGSTLQECNYVTGAKIFGVQVEKNSEKCQKDDKLKIKMGKHRTVETKVITKGSRPTNIKHWATQNFTPVPLRFQLSPIINLMSDQYINKAALFTRNKKRVTGFGIRKWFVPLYFNFCQSMGISCRKQTGCGYDDKCPLDAICQKGGKKHYCTEWSSWGCIWITCGQTGRQQRTRKCQGCSGLTVETKKSNSCQHKRCLRCDYSNGDGSGGSETYIGMFATKEKCRDACMKKKNTKDPSINGATFSRNGIKKCYCERKMGGIKSNTRFKTCMFRWKGTTMRKVACENHRLSISCPSNWKINLESYMYGRTNRNICSDIWKHVLITNCWSSNRWKIRHFCQGKQQCSFKASNSVFGDPCLFTTKYAEVTYHCERST